VKLSRGVSVLVMLALLSSLCLAAQVQITAGPIIETADSHSATISWFTDQPANSRVWYSQDADDLTQIAEGEDRTTEHRVRLEGLQPNTTYFFQIESVQNSSVRTENPALMTFRTVAPGQQAVHNLKAVIAEKGAANGENGNLSASHLEAR
jgi:phosphodiesterase/alkaline phosphatase D-like protein